jgi:serine/threonine protein kinase
LFFHHFFPFCLFNYFCQICLSSNINIGFDANGTVKLYDFGLARELPASSDLSNGLFHMTQNTGSPRYMDPAVALGRPYNELVDVYSFSILLWEILALETPFRNYFTIKLFHKNVILGGVRPQCDPRWPQPIVDLMVAAWQDLSQLHLRPTMTKVVYALATEVEPEYGEETIEFLEQQENEEQIDLEGQLLDATAGNARDINLVDEIEGENTHSIEEEFETLERAMLDATDGSVDSFAEDCNGEECFEFAQNEESNAGTGNEASDPNTSESQNEEKPEGIQNLQGASLDATNGSLDITAVDWNGDQGAGFVQDEENNAVHNIVESMQIHHDEKESKEEKAETMPETSLDVTNGSLDSAAVAWQDEEKNAGEVSKSLDSPISECAHQENESGRDKPLDCEILDFEQHDEGKEVKEAKRFDDSGPLDAELIHTSIDCTVTLNQMKKQVESDDVVDYDSSSDDDIIEIWAEEGGDIETTLSPDEVNGSNPEPCDPTSSRLVLMSEANTTMNLVASTGNPTTEKETGSESDWLNLEPTETCTTESSSTEMYLYPLKEQIVSAEYFTGSLHQLSHRNTCEFPVLYCGPTAGDDTDLPLMYNPYFCCFAREIC